MSEENKSGEDQQLLHLVFGGELEDPAVVNFRDLESSGYCRNLPQLPRQRLEAWKSKAQQTVDNAHMRYFIVHMHRLLDPDGDGNFG